MRYGIPKWILQFDDEMAKIQVYNEMLDKKHKSRRRDELANKIADLVVKKLKEN